MSLPAPLNIIFRRSSLSVIARLDREIHHFMSCLSDAPVKPEHDWVEWQYHFPTLSPFCHCPTWSGNPPLYVLFFRYSGQAGAWLGGISFSDIFPFLSLPDLIGQSVCGCGCLVLGYSGQAGVWQGKKGAGVWQKQKGNNSGKKPEYEVIYAFGIFNLQNKNYLLK